MNTTVIEHLDADGRRREVDFELMERGLTRCTLNDPVNRQRIITALEARFPRWREEVREDLAR